ncbi:transposase [Bacteroides caecimuris]|uniref:transposase n=1 Tax=Bacteroides caecimuris TaxID=1796613 RepID=UPI002649A838|nr:transposase [Bacteroides caecimuris]
MLRSYDIRASGDLLCSHRQGFEFGQQKINFNFYELALPDDDPVYTLKKVMEDLDFSGLLACYSDQGRTGYNPIMLYAVVTYANMRGVRAVDRIVDLCQRDLAFILLTKGQRPKRDTFYDFKGKKLKGEVLDELNYQFLRRLEKEGLITLKQLYIDGTKIEGNFRTRADSITGNRTKRNGGRKKFNVKFIVKTGDFLYN